MGPEHHGDEKAKMLGESLGIAISNGREPSSCLGQVFNFKFGSFVSIQCNCMTYTQPLLDLKTRPRFGPVSKICPWVSAWSFIE